MKVRNETRYLTADLRRLIGAVAARELEAKQRKRLLAVVRYRRRGNIGVGGFGWYHTGQIMITMDKDHRPSPIDFAYVVAHEIAHAFRGVDSCNFGVDT
jgi:hypothetical protein